jgi:hypothetical protein
VIKGFLLRELPTRSHRIGSRVLSQPGSMDDGGVGWRMDKSFA